MRCPKCHYISFDSTERCRNCGYEFAFAADPPAIDLPIQTGEEALGPLADFPIGEVSRPHTPPRPARAKALNHGSASESPAEPPRPVTSVFDLPLFNDRLLDDDRPLVTPPAVPRQPLAVRRSSPLPPRPPRTLMDEPAFDLDALEPEAAPIHHAPWLPKAELRRHVNPEREPPVGVAAGVAPRLAAGMIDALILAIICTGVLYITLEVCGLRLDQLHALPVPPLLAFIVLLVGGYFVLLTAAGGQTMGKMAAGIRVVPMDSTNRVSLGHSTIRAAGYLVSLLPAGLGLVPALVHADRRALHDRLADTRVVKA
jgi:uncharacterized RDD family membrane protein YckC